MSLPGYVPGMPGISTVKTATPRIVFRQGDWTSDLAGGKIIDGSKSRDSGNTGDLPVLRPGLLMGKITSSGKYAPSILGVTTGAYTNGGTSLTVSAAQAVEISRRVGASGTLKAIGPPTAAGTVAITAVTYSAIDTTTGILTVTDLGVDKIAGTFITSTDGSQVPVTLISDMPEYGIKVTDVDETSIDVPFPHFPIAGVITTANLLPAWPSDTSLQAWINTSLNTYGKYVFDNGF